MEEGEIFKVSCNPRRSVLYKHRRQQGITISCVCLGYRESPCYRESHCLIPGASTAPLSAASFLTVMLKGSPGGNISAAPFWVSRPWPAAVYLLAAMGCVGMCRDVQGCVRILGGGKRVVAER